MTGNTPLVSICIPTYNRADLLVRAVSSALSQSYQNLEVIVVDNASTDNTHEVIKHFKDKRLKFFTNEWNLGLFGNFNRCIELAQGDYIHILHSDDIIGNNFTENCIKFYTDHPSVKITTTSARIIGKNGTKNISYSDRDLVFPAPEGLRRLLCDRGFIVSPSVMVHRDVYWDIGAYSLEYPYSSDFYQWFKITRKYDIGFVSNAWLDYHQGEHSESYRLLFSNPSGYIDTLKILIRIISDLGTDDDQFTEDINCAAKRFMYDCLYAGIVRSNPMKKFYPSIFIGIALTSWSLIGSRSLKTTIDKIILLFFVGAFSMIIFVSPVRRLVQKLILRNNPDY